MNKIFPSENKYKILLIVMMLVGIGFVIAMMIANAFPASLGIGFVALLIIMLVLTSIFCNKEKKVFRIAGIVIAVLFILIYGMGTYYLATTYNMFSKISVDQKQASAVAKNVNVTEDSFNIYITGIDQWDKEKGYDLERSDVNMIVTVCPKSRTILLTSIPRDSYVALHRTGTMDKLTHTGIYGVDETLNTVEDWLGINLNYYVKTNFSAAVEVIDAMGGVDVYSDRQFIPKMRNWWTVKKGWNHMNGREALAFARERKAYNSDDSKRVLNQQKVVKAMLNKMLSSSTLLTKYGDIMSAAGESLETNMSVKEMQQLVKMQLADLGKWDIKTQRIDGKYDMDYVASMANTAQYLVYKTYDSSVKKAVENIKKTMNPTTAQIAKATADRQKNSIFSFFKGLRGDK